MKGKRARIASKALALALTKESAPDSLQFSIGDRVVVHMQGESFTGIFKGESVKSPGKFKVRIDESELEPDYLVKVDRKQLSHQMCRMPGCKRFATLPDRLCNTCRRDLEEEKAANKKDKALENTKIKGEKEIELFKSSGVKWKKDHSFFRLETSQGVKFYGWYRRTRQRNSSGMAHCFDIYCKRLQADGNERELAVDSLVYLDFDPRKNRKALDADIVALVNRWYFQRLNGRADTLDQILKRADKPTIRIDNLRTIDGILLRLKEYRDTAIRCGGERLLEVKGDNDNPPITFIINVSSQAFALKGRIPTLYKGSVYDAARGSGKKGGERFNVLKPEGSPENIKHLIEALERAKETRNKVEARKIRATLRQMGHRGGARFKGDESPE